MASDSSFYTHGDVSGLIDSLLGRSNQYTTDARVPFNTLKTTADASGNGVEVVAAAAAGKSHYVKGFVFYNGSVGALRIYAAHTAGAGQVQIAPNISVATLTSVVVNFEEPLQVGTAKNLGIVASAGGALEIQMFGYTV